MKFSRFYAPSTKNISKDIVLPSHIFLIRGGFIEQVGAGLYNFLPLGKMVLDKIINIIKDEMDKAGALQVDLSFITPALLWQESGRYDIFGKELLRFKDRKNNEFILGPTHEEAMLNLIKNKITSYKQLPLNLYQIGLKFRDEARPRFGLLRCREFIMKDAYSFHCNENELDKEFNLMFDTYNKIFKKLELNFRAVDADSGAIGGNGSKEFMVLTKNGEDDVVICDKCDYAANIEIATRAKKICDKERPQANYTSKFYTPNIKTIKELADFFKIDEFFTIKAIVKKAIYKDEVKLIIFFIRGCDELQETKALNACNAIEIIDASEEDIKKAGLIAGYIGFVGLKNIDFFIDNELKNEKNMIIGANEENYHLVGIDVINLNENRYKDLIVVKQNDTCIKCGGKLNFTKGIEVGHIFKLGQKYSKTMQANFLNEHGVNTPFFMGCYGIGVSRLVAVAVENSFDDKGIIWSDTLSPFVLDIIISNTKDEKASQFANSIYEKLKELNLNVLLDDREERFGVKINDFELMGFCYALIIGKEFKNEKVELIERKNLNKSIIKTNEVLDKLKEILL